MILNSRNNNFIVSFPRKFFYKEIEDRYTPYLKKLPLPYESLVDYMNASIQSVTFPQFSFETVDQVLYEDPVSAKGGKRPIWYLDKQFTVTFKSYEGYINYWIMWDLITTYWSLDQKDKFLPDMNLRFMDHTGFEFMSVNFQQIILTGLSELELNYSSNSADFKNFSATFKYNYIDVKRRLQ